MSTVITSDGVFMGVDEKLIVSCSLFKSITEDCEDFTMIPIPNVNSEIMGKVIEFSNTGCITGADDLMLQILMAADYIGYEELLDYGARIVADSLKGKSAQEIRNYFGITQPTPVS